MSSASIWRVSPPVMDAREMPSAIRCGASSANVTTRPMMILSMKGQRSSLYQDGRLLRKEDGAGCGLRYLRPQGPAGRHQAQYRPAPPRAMAPGGEPHVWATPASPANAVL